MQHPNLDSILSRLEGVTKAGDGYKALCPAHDDHNPSLSIDTGKNGRPILYCHVGCSYDRIIAAMGLDRPDTRSSSAQSTQRKLVATYDYCDEHGALLCQKVRYEPKDFRIRRPDGDGWTWKKGDARPVLYRLPELQQAIVTGQATVFITEGEKDADRLHAVGRIATTNIEGASEPGKRPKWKPEYSDQVAGAARVIILPDNDPPGRAHAADIAVKLAGRVVDIRILELPGLPEKGDVSDWLNQGHTVEELLKMVEATPPYAAPDTEPPEREPPPVDAYSDDPEARGARPEPAATTATEDWPEPQPLPTGLPSVEPFEPGLLPDTFRPWTEDIADRMQCPPDFPAIGAMIGSAGTVGKQVGIRPKRWDDWTVTPNLWGGAVGRPGIMKSPALTETIKPVQRLEIAAKERYDGELKEFEVFVMLREENKKVASGKIREALKKGYDAARIAREVVEAEQPEPIRRRFIVNDPSVEKLGELLNQNPNGLLLSRDELIGFLRTLDKEGHENARAFYLEAWNGDSRYTYDRIGRGTIEIEHACLSIIGGIQPGPLLDYMRTAPDDGLMQRFQLLVWPDVNGEWRDIDRWPDSNAKNAAYAVFERLANLNLSAIGANQDPGAIPYLRFSNEAQELFGEWRCELETRLRQNDLPEALESHLAKYRSLIPALSLLIHLADGNPGPVGLDALERACAWGEYLESHAKRIYAPAIAPDRIGARALAKRLLAGDLSDRFTLRDVYRPCWSHLADQESAFKAASMLVDFDWLILETEHTGGRPRTWYVVNPRIKEVAL